MKRRVRATSPKERAAIESRFMPSARELFPVLRARLLASRPIVEPARQVKHEFGTIVVPAVYGAPTFRNVIDEYGQHV